MYRPAKVFTMQYLLAGSKIDRRFSAIYQIMHIIFDKYQERRSRMDAKRTLLMSDCETKTISFLRRMWFPAQKKIEKKLCKRWEREKRDE